MLVAITRVVFFTNYQTKCGLGNYRNTFTLIYCLNIFQYDSETNYEYVCKDLNGKIKDLTDKK